MRLIAPGVVVFTVLVFVSGLLFAGAAHRGPWVAIHKVSFVVWLLFTGLHVLGHIPGLGASLRAPRRRGGELGGDGGAGRALALAGAIVGGLVLAIVLIPQFGSWRPMVRPAPRALSRRGCKRCLTWPLALSHRSLSDGFDRHPRLVGEDGST